MPTKFPIETTDGIRICEAQDGFLWTLGSSVGFTRLPPVALAAAALLVPSTRYDDLAGLVKRIAKVAKKRPGATVSEIMADVIGWRAPVEHVVRQPSELEQHVRNGCRRIRCSVCG